jgi:uncharacterized protein YfiM (DUF2279 family)
LNFDFSTEAPALKSPVVGKERSGEMKIAAFRLGRGMVEDEAAHVGLSLALQLACSSKIWDSNYSGWNRYSIGGAIP